MRIKKDPDKFSRIFYITYDILMILVITIRTNYCTGSSDHSKVLLSTTGLTLLAPPSPHSVLVFNVVLSEPQRPNCSSLLPQSVLPLVKNLNMDSLSRVYSLSEVHLSSLRDHWIWCVIVPIICCSNNAHRFNLFGSICFVSRGNPD